MPEDQSASLLDRFGLSNGPQLPRRSPRHQLFASLRSDIQSFIGHHHRVQRPRGFGARGLASGYEKLVMLRVVFIAEADRSTAALIPEDEPVVTELLIEQKREKSTDFKRVMEEAP